MQLFCPHELPKGEICCALKGKTSSFLLGLRRRDGSMGAEPPNTLRIYNTCTRLSLLLGADPQSPLRIPEGSGLEGP